MTLSGSNLGSTPTGTPDDDVTCDSCTKAITSIEQLIDGEPAVAYLYATGAHHGCSLRWTNCHDCGPLANQATESGEVHALAFLIANRGGHVEVGPATILDSPPTEEVSDQ